MSEEIIYLIKASFFGFVLVGHSKTGVCAILIDNEPAVLQAELKTRFPSATLTAYVPLIKEGLDLESLTERIIKFIEKPEGPLDVALDIRGTVFQKKIWNALLQIPLGQTVSYTEVAKKVHQPKAVRAAAGACAANPLAIAIPCHRVIKSNGTLSGYRWGVDRKKKLLEIERDMMRIAR